MFARLAILLLIGCVFSRPANAQIEVHLKPDWRWENKDDKKDETVRVKTLVLTVVNGTHHSVNIPETYSPDTVRVCALGSDDALVLYRRQYDAKGVSGAVPPETKARVISLAPGKRHDVLRVDASDALFAPGDIYSLNPSTEFAEPRWVWGWRAHPGPDYSPFEKRKGDKRKDVAVLWCEVDVDGQTLRSVPIMVKAERENVE